MQACRSGNRAPARRVPEHRAPVPACVRGTKPAPRPPRGLKLDPYKGFILRRLAEGVDNGVLPRELRVQGDAGSHAILKDFLQPLRARRVPRATVRFKTAPGEQAQVDSSSCPYGLADGRAAGVAVHGWR